MIDFVGEITTFVIKFMPRTWLLQLGIHSIATHKSETSQDIHKRILETALSEWSGYPQLQSVRMRGLRSQELGQSVQRTFAVIASFFICNGACTDFQSNS